MFESPDASTEFVDFWNEILVPKYMKYRHVLVDGLTHHSAKIFPSLAVETGDHALDVGCGFGDTALRLAERVGSSGSVLGIDCCEAFIEIARRDAAETDCENVTFQLGDAQFYAFEPMYDFCFSRFGTMFFANPVAGLRNMRQALKPGGRMAMIVWRTIDDNPWLALPKEVVLQYLPPPGDGARTCGPGPFSMADRDMVSGMLRSAGYEDIAFERIDAPLMVGASTTDAIGFQLALGPAGEVFREAGEAGEERRGDIEAALHDALDNFSVEGGVIMDSSSWKITARNPQ